MQHQPAAAEDAARARDRELLELAAKAAGIPAYWSVDGTVQNRPMLAVKAGGGMGTMPYEVEWNPLRDDATALRLAASLRLSIKPGKNRGDGCTVETQRPGVAGCTAFRDDGAEQMRRAIVQAAAEIGRSTP